MTSPSSTQDRQIRVFIPSTFRDMMRERDLLVKQVFPELCRKCARQFVISTELDLRWGLRPHNEVYRGCVEHGSVCGSGESE